MKFSWNRVFINTVKVLVLSTLSFNHISAYAFDLNVEHVTGHIYALVGDTGPRTEVNAGLNNTLGFIEANHSVILVSSGTNEGSTKLIQEAIRTITEKPIKYVINVGTQDHHWMGNYYFSAQGADVIALQKTVDAQKANLDSQMTRLEQGIKSGIKSVKPQHAANVINSDHHVMELDGVKLELIWPGKGHFAGDTILWISKHKTVFTGDLVFMDRILGIHPTSDVVAWQKSFHTMEKLNPQHIIPGHGRPTDLDGAKRDTGNYLDWLTIKVRKAQEEWLEIDETINSMSDAPQFKHLEHFDGWHRRNIHQTYLQMEAAQ